VRYELYGKTEVEVIQQDKICFTLDNRHLSDDNVSFEKKIAIPQGVLSGRFSVFYRQVEIPADSFNILIGGVKAGILTAFEAIGKIQGKGGKFNTLLDRFIEWLGVQNRANDADKFEMAVWTLLTLSGLRVIHLGQVFGKGFDLPGVDLLAFDEANKELFLISCTIENKLSGKIEPLLRQLNAVKDSMENWSVSAAIIAPVERRDVTIGSFSDAIETDISVLLRLEIQEILTIVKGASADASARLLEVLKRRPLPVYEDSVIKVYQAWLQEPNQDVM
jgi:hypothetical protein